MIFWTRSALEAGLTGAFISAATFKGNWIGKGVSFCGLGQQMAGDRRAGASAIWPPPRHRLRRHRLDTARPTQHVLDRLADGQRGAEPAPQTGLTVLRVNGVGDETGRCAVHIGGVDALSTTSSSKASMADRASPG